MVFELWSNPVTHQSRVPVVRLHSRTWWHGAWCTIHHWCPPSRRRKSLSRMSSSLKGAHGRIRSYSWFDRCCWIWLAMTSINVTCSSLKQLKMKLLQMLQGEVGSPLYHRDPSYWLMNIRIRYHVYRHRVHYVIDPYMPNRFARQFGYDQLYVSNTNHTLGFEGSLLDGARAWYYSIAGVLVPPSFFL